jgi:lysophospholipase L1-like esterase
MWLGGTSGYPATTETQFNGYVKDLVITRSGPALAPQSIVYVFGDSVTWGYSTSGVTMSYPTKLGQLLGPAYSVWNHGIPGALVPAVATEQTKTLTLEAAPAYVVILAGVNSVRNSVPTATVQSQLQAMYEEVVAAGAVPIPVTITPWAGFAGWSAGLQTNTETVNAWILAYCASNSLTCVDAYTDLLGVAGALDAEYDSGDHLHPNQAGTDRIAALVRAAIP